MLTGGSGDQNLAPLTNNEVDAGLMVARVRSMLYFAVENKGTKVDGRSGRKKALVMMDRLKGIFSKYDSNGSGMLGREDIRRMVRGDLKVPERLVSEKDIEHLFIALDLDEGGTVDFQEFLKFVQKPRRRVARNDQDVVDYVARAVRITLMKNNIRIKDLEANFNKFDESGDIPTGELGPDDMVRYFRKVLKLSKHECADKALRIAFHAMDDDCSGKMSLEELMEFIKYCSMERSQTKLPSRVPGLIGGMRGELPRRLPSRRPGSSSAAPGERPSSVPFCLNGRDVDTGGRLARSTRCGLVRSASAPGMRSQDLRQVAPHDSQELSTTFSLQQLADDVHAEELSRPASPASVIYPGLHAGHQKDSQTHKKKVWSGKFPGEHCDGYSALKGAKRLNKVENRLFEAGIDVRGRYHTLGRIRVSNAWA